MVKHKNENIHKRFAKQYHVRPRYTRYTEEDLIRLQFLYEYSTVSKMKFCTFNPISRQHLDTLIKTHNWQRKSHELNLMPPDKLIQLKALCTESELRNHGFISIDQLDTTDVISDLNADTDISEELVQQEQDIPQTDNSDNNIEANVENTNKEYVNNTQEDSSGSDHKTNENKTNTETKQNVIPMFLHNANAKDIKEHANAFNNNSLKDTARSILEQSLKSLAAKIEADTVVEVITTEMMRFDTATQSYVKTGATKTLKKAKRLEATEMAKILQSMHPFFVSLGVIPKDTPPPSTNIQINNNTTPGQQEHNTSIKTLFVNNSLDVRFQDIMQQVLERSKNEEDHDWQKR